MSCSSLINYTVQNILYKTIKVLFENSLFFKFLVAYGRRTDRQIDLQPFLVAYGRRTDRQIDQQPFWFLYSTHTKTTFDNRRVLKLSRYHSPSQNQIRRYRLRVNTHIYQLYHIREAQFYIRCFRHWSNRSFSITVLTQVSHFPSYITVRTCNFTVHSVLCTTLRLYTVYYTFDWMCTSFTYKQLDRF